MESLAPSVNISAPTNDEEVEQALHESLDSRLVLINANKTLLMWQYFAMVKDEPIMRNKIHYVYCCLLCLKKCPHKFLDSLVAIYNDTTSNVHKHIASRHPSLHLACKHQSFEPK
jgi:hypothetical protein